MNTKLIVAGKEIQPGTDTDIHLSVGESYMGTPLSILIRITRSEKPGPIVFISGGIHGDELNGVGIVRSIMLRNLNLKKGTLICLPITNLYGFENHSRYLPDRRDLNRSFPGNSTGSLASRLASKIFKEVICKCNYGIDLHSAAIRRTNFPQIRADLSHGGMDEFSKSFGCELIINKKGHPNSLRSAATEAGCLTLLYEAGEVYKFEPGAIDLGVRGVLNVLKYLDMISGEIQKPIYQTIIEKTFWIRSDTGGIISFHVLPGDIVKKGAPIASIEKLFSNEKNAVFSSYDGLVLGMTTHPAVKPGDPLCHLAIPHLSISEINKKLKKKPSSLHRKVQEQLKTNIKTTEPSSGK